MTGSARDDGNGFCLCMRNEMRDMSIPASPGRFVAFDVETPNRLNHRMSAIGISVIENGRITEEFESLVDPETDFEPYNTWLTGIDEYAVRGAPTFPQLWPVIEPVMRSGVLVAHNAAFDLRVLRSCLRDYDIEWQDRAEYLCTVQMGRKLLPEISHKLDALCRYYGIRLEHHHAGSDSHACAEVLLRYLTGGADAARFIKTYVFDQKNGICR